MDGVLNINKPAGPTSHDIVARTRKLLHEKRVGHAGTLDPLATGVLVVCVGKATRIVEYLVTREKEYSAVMVLGRTTGTQDSVGKEISNVDASHISQQMIAAVLPKFTGRIMQIPPMVSAVKHEGKRLYELARKNVEVERQPREVTIYSLEMTSFNPGEKPFVGLRVVCSSGTYIRTLCADIGDALGVGGYMESLVRTRVGDFKLENAISMDVLETASSEGRASEFMLSMDEALSHIPSVTVDDIGSEMIAHGRAVQVSFVGEDNELVRVRSEQRELLAVGRLRSVDTGKIIEPEKVFAGV